MAKNPIDEAVKRWNVIASQAQAAGIPLTAYRQLGQDDINRVAQGHQGMSAEEAQAAVMAAAGHAPIAAPQRPTNPFAILGNIPSDLADIARGLNPPTLARNIYRQFAEIPKFDWHALTDPSSTANGYHDVSHAGILSQFAEAARRDATIPVISMLPGLHTLAGATTSQGRKGLEQHPLGTTLDVLPLAGAASKLAGVSLAEGSTAEALQEAHPLKALWRATPDALTSPVGSKVEDVMRALKIDPDTRALWRAKSEADNASIAELHKFIDGNVHPFIDNMSEEERTLLYHEATDPLNYPNPSPEHASLIDQARSIRDYFGKLGTSLGKLHPVTIGDRTIYYSLEGGEGQVVSGMRASEFHQGRLEAAVRDLRASEDRINKRTETLKRSIDEEHTKIKQYQFQGQGARLRQAQQRLFKLEESLKSLQSDNVLNRRRATVNSRLTKVHAVNTDLMRNFIRNAPAEYHPMLEAELRSRAMIKATGMYGEGSPALEDAMNRMDQGDFSRVYDKKEWKATTDEVRQTWTKFIASGLDPVWVHTVREHQFESVTKTTPLAERYVTPASVRAKSFNLQPRLSDVAVGMTATASEYLRTLGTERLIDTYVKPYLMTNEDVNAALQPQLARELKGGVSSMRSVGTTLDRLRVQDYEKFDPAAMWNFSTPKLRAMASEKEYYLPKHVANAVREMTRPPEVSTIGRFTRRTTSLFKTSVLAFSPRYIAHTLFGGTTMLLLRGHFEDWASLTRAIDYARNPTLFPSAVSHGLDQLSTDQLFSEAAGNTMGTIWSKLFGAEKGMYKAHEFIANVQRAMAYLGGKDRGLRLGMTDAEAELQGVTHANKVFMDWNGMTPFERTIIRQVFPFYGFTRHIVGYIITYPFDHPMRAAIFSNLAEAEQKDWDSGLPKTFQNLFYLGSADANGNVKAVDTRTFNPFRDVANYFTLRGFFSSVHPLAQAFLEAGGVNPLTGSPQLYSQLTIDEQTGKLVTKRPSGLPLRLAESIVPEVGAVDHFVGLTNNMRSLKTSNPEAYRKQLFNALNIPFVPYNYNLPSVRGKDEMTRYRLAGQLLSAAETSNQWGDIKRFNAVPFQGQMVDPRRLQELWSQAIASLHSTGSSISPKSELPTRRTKPALLSQYKPST